AFEMHPHRDLAPAFLAPLIKTVSGDNTAPSIDERLEGRQLRQCFGAGVDHPVADRRVCDPMRNQPPVHEPALVTAPVSDDDGNRWRSLFRGDIKAWCVAYSPGRGQNNGASHRGSTSWSVASKLLKRRQGRGRAGKVTVSLRSRWTQGQVGL